MSTSAHSRARRVAVPENLLGSGFERADYATAFAVTAPGPSPRSTEQWARTMFEGAPAAVRWCLTAGWRGVLGLQLVRGRSPQHVAGWQIITTSAGVTELEARSSLLTARKYVQVDGARVTVTTLVHYERPIARALWRAVLPVHLVTEPYLLGGAARRRSNPPSRG